MCTGAFAKTPVIDISKQAFSAGARKWLSNLPLLSIAMLAFLLCPCFRQLKVQAGLAKDAGEAVQRLGLSIWPLWSAAQP